MQSHHYPIGTPGQKWQEKERVQWLAQQSVKRSYNQDVVSQIELLGPNFDVQPYGQLVYSMGSYSLFALRSQAWSPRKPTALITGGVHGYETSGVMGALRFAEVAAQRYQDVLNVLIVPCVSPWGYETINRWNPHAIDPNRSFYANSPAQESAALMTLVADLNVALHIDLHETTDTDNSEFRPALAARDAIEYKEWAIPDGFYTVGDTLKPSAKLQKAIVEGVEKVTHIAPADESGCIIGEPIQQKGVINYATKALGLCAGVTEAEFVSTTEVYPDSPLVDDENCILAQVAAVSAALDYMIDTF